MLNVLRELCYNLTNFEVIVVVLYAAENMICVSNVKKKWLGRVYSILQLKPWVILPYSLFLV
jgi:hypothetical protein